jgi:hypothetical protein
MKTEKKSKNIQQTPPISQDESLEVPHPEQWKTRYTRKAIESLSYTEKS